MKNVTGALTFIWNKRKIVSLKSQMLFLEFLNVFFSFWLHIYVCINDQVGVYQTGSVVSNNPGCPSCSLFLLFKLIFEWNSSAKLTSTPTKHANNHKHVLTSHVHPYFLTSFIFAMPGSPCFTVSDRWRKISSSTSWVKKEFDYWRHIFNTLL